MKIMAVCLIVGSFFQSIFAQDQKVHNYVVNPLAFDRFASVVGNPREPYELIIAESLTPSDQLTTQIIRIVVFPETTGRRGGTKPLNEGAFRPFHSWKVRGRIATSSQLGTICASDNYFRAADGSIDTDENGEPVMRFQSVRYDGLIFFKDLAKSMCVIADSAPVLAKGK